MNAGDSDTLQSRLSDIGKCHAKVVKLYALAFALDRKARQLEAEAEAIMAKWDDDDYKHAQAGFKWEP